MPMVLNTSNKPDKITTKQYAGYKKALKKGFSYNETYNIKEFGIDRATYQWVKQAISSISGLHGDLPTLVEINKWIKDPTLLKDTNGNYLSYLTKTINI